MAFGLRVKPTGTHLSSTIRLDELRNLLASVQAPNSTLEDYREAVVEQNVLGKPSTQSRRIAFNRLRELYGLDPDLLIFRSLRDLWEENVADQPELALLCSTARDPILRAITPFLVQIPEGTQVTPKSISEEAEKRFPDKFAPTSRDRLSRNSSRVLAHGWIALRKAGQTQGKAQGGAHFSSICTSAGRPLWQKRARALQQPVVFHPQHGKPPARQSGCCRLPTGMDRVQISRRRSGSQFQAPHERGDSTLTMSEIESLIEAYAEHVGSQWERNLAGPQKVWFPVYDPGQERRLRPRVGEFENATVSAGHRWCLVDITDAFAEWMANHEYRDSYFERPEDMALALSDFAEFVSNKVSQILSEPDNDEDTVVAVLGLASLFGLARASDLVSRVSSQITGRMVVFFPGQNDGPIWRLLNARDGWNYHAVPITGKSSRRT